MKNDYKVKYRCDMYRVVVRLNIIIIIRRLKLIGYRYDMGEDNIIYNGYRSLSAPPV